MTQIRKVVLLVGLVFLVLGVRVEVRGDARQEHGVFTGEIKPVFYVTDVESSTPFYRDALGFVFDGFANRKGAPYYAEMVAGRMKFGLHEPMSTGQEAKVGQQRLYFRVQDLAAHRARVIAWGGMPGEIKKTGWMDMFIVTDPDGNEVVFAVTDAARHTINPWNTTPFSRPTEENE